MKCSVFGLSHLGYITAACLAFWGHIVDASDLSECEPPHEPRLQALLDDALNRERLHFHYGPPTKPADVLWIALDMPLDTQCRADLTRYFQHVAPVLKAANAGTLVLISSQLPVGTCSELQADYPSLDFAYVPENLRRGQAVANFLDPDSVVIGTANRVNFDRVVRLYPTRFATRILWTTPESAEMSKHAVNAYLGMCIVFANELSRLCADAGADYTVIEQRLRRDERIGKHAYLRAGPADVAHFLREYWNLSALPQPSPFIQTTLETLKSYNTP